MVIQLSLGKEERVEVHVGSVEDPPLFYQMCSTASSRDEFVIRPFSD
jgi:hypothetical protein